MSKQNDTLGIVRNNYQTVIITPRENIQKQSRANDYVSVSQRVITGINHYNLESRSRM